MTHGEAPGRDNFNNNSLRLLYSGALGVSVDAFTQLLQQNVETLPDCSPVWLTLWLSVPCLTVSIYCFAFSIPLMAFGILLLTDRQYTDWPMRFVPAEVVFVVGSTLIGLPASLIGTFFLFLHFYGRAAFIFIAASGVAVFAWLFRLR